MCDPGPDLNTQIVVALGKLALAVTLGACPAIWLGRRGLGTWRTQIVYCPLHNLPRKSRT